MARRCEICGKEPHFGNTIVRHGLSKKSGGIGLHTTGITRRRFLPNLQRIKAKVNGGTRTMNVCTSCIKGNKVAKA